MMIKKTEQKSLMLAENTIEQAELKSWTKSFIEEYRLALDALAKK
jgi:hypothetical protein